MSTRQEILSDAARLVSGDREVEHGNPQDNFSLVARFWESYLRGRAIPGDDGKDVDCMSMDAHDVAVMMTLFKVARCANRPSGLDSYIDVAGYASLAGEIQVNKKESF